MDKHLVFLVKQTERYTTLLAENMLSDGHHSSSTDDILTGDKDHEESSIVSVELHSAVINSPSSSSQRTRQHAIVEQHDRIHACQSDGLSCRSSDNVDHSSSSAHEHSIHHSSSSSSGGGGRTRKVRFDDEMMSSIPGHRNNRNARRTTHVIGTSNEKEVFIEDDHEKDKEEDEDSDGEEDEDDEFEFQEEVDDETTLIEQEEMELQLEGSEDRQGELELLQRESEIPIEQLRAMYAGMRDHSSDDDD